MVELPKKNKFDLILNFLWGGVEYQILFINFGFRIEYNDSTYNINLFDEFKETSKINKGGTDSAR